MRSLIFLIVLSFAFFACGGDSGTSPNKDSNASEETGSDKVTSSSSGKSSSSNKKESSDTSSSVNKKSSSSKKGKNISSSSSSKSFKKCTSDKEGVRAFVTQENSWCICINGLWIPESSSSFVEPSSSSKYYDMTKQFFSEYDCNFGEFVDSRDNQVYKTIRIKSIWTEDSVTFFAENLNYGKMVPAGTLQTDSTKYCYDDDPWYCENGFGGLYTWATAMNFPAVCDSFPMRSVECPDTVDLTKHSDPFLKGKVGYAFHQGICPEGWHIMDEGDWVDIIHGHGFILGANYLGSYIWGGSNERGFSLLPAGNFEVYKDTLYRYKDLGKYAFHWLPSEYLESNGSITKKGKLTYVSSDQWYREAGLTKSCGLSVRCVMDY
ncbi:MAG: hypothetical protein J6T54_03690, partial [Fibrobacter sp.]|nr:hypothetical protein [Fibrobacter sp.]